MPWSRSLRTGKLRHRLLHPPADQPPDGGVLCLAFSPDGRLLAAGGWGKAATVWDVASGKRWCELPGHEYWVSSLCLSPDGKTLATAHSDKTIRLWEVLSGRERGRLAGHAHRVTQLAFAPDGRLASSSHDRTVRVWDLAAMKEAGRFEGHDAVVGPLAFSADGKQLASGGWDTTILVWDVQRIPRRRAKRIDLSAEEGEALWRDLADADAARAYRAIRRLTLAGESVASLLDKRLRPVPVAEAVKMTRLIAALNSKHFEERAKAEAELARLREQAKPALRQALDGKDTSLELRRRVERLLERLHGPIASGERLRQLRAVEVLEHVGTAGVPLLRKIAGGAPQAPLTREARAALDRR
jgi:hypothetical protein